MAENDDAEIEEGLPRKVHVELFIVHPTISPAEITATLGLEAHVAHKVGDQRKTPKGRVLEGLYPDTRWRHSVEYELHSQWFADKVATLVEALVPHKAFFHQLRASGGKAEIGVQFFCDGYLGDNLSLQTLAQMTELQLTFGVECFWDAES